MFVMRYDANKCTFAMKGGNSKYAWKYPGSTVTSQFIPHGDTYPHIHFTECRAVSGSKKTWQVDEFHYSDGKGDTFWWKISSSGEATAKVSGTTPSPAATEYVKRFVGSLGISIK